MDVQQLVELANTEQQSQLPLRIRCCMAAGCLSANAQSVFDRLKHAVDAQAEQADPRYEITLSTGDDELVFGPLGFRGRERRHVEALMERAGVRLARPSRRELADPHVAGHLAGATGWGEQPSTPVRLGARLDERLEDPGAQRRQRRERQRVQVDGFTVLRRRELGLRRRRDDQHAARVGRRRGTRRDVSAPRRLGVATRGAEEAT